MPPADRTRLAPFVHGRQATWPIRFRQDGSVVNLDGKSLVAKAKHPDGTKVTLSITARSPQSGKDEGVADLVVSAAQSETGGAGEWLIDAYIGESPGAEERPSDRFMATCEPKETE